MPVSSTTWRPPRSRTWRTRATRKPARATSARPGSIARRRGRRSAGIASSSAGSSRANRAGSGAASPSGRTGKPPPMSSVSNSGRVPPRAARGARAHAGPHPATRRPPGAASRHGGGSRGARARRRRPTTSTAADSSSAVIPNFDVPAPTASSRSVSGTTSGFSRKSTSSRAPRRRSMRPGDSHERLGLVQRFDRDPPKRRPVGRCPAGRPQVGVGLADALERDPVVRQAGPPGDRPLAARDDVGVEAETRDASHDRARRRSP